MALAIMCCHMCTTRSDLRCAPVHGVLPAWLQAPPSPGLERKRTWEERLHWHRKALRVVVEVLNAHVAAALGVLAAGLPCQLALALLHAALGKAAALVTARRALLRRAAVGHGLGFS